MGTFSTLHTSSVYVGIYKYIFKSNFHEKVLKAMLLTLQKVLSNGRNYLPILWEFQRPEVDMGL